MIGAPKLLPQQQRFAKPRILRGEESSLLAADDVVVALLWHRGDVLNATALLPGLQSRHNRPITFATVDCCVPILEHNPFLKNIIAFDMAWPKRVRPRDFERIDALITQAFSHVQNLYNLHIPLHLKAVHGHIVEAWAKALGLGSALSQPFYYPGPIAISAPRHGQSFVLGNGGASWNKHWRTANWRTFIELMRSRFPQIRLIQLGSPEDPFIAGAEDHRGRTSIEESHRILTQAKGCLSNDSFLSHLSAAAGCPTYVIYGSHRSQQVCPRGTAKVVTFDGRLRCSPCYRDWCMVSFGITTCLAHVSAVEVFARIAEDLAEDTEHIRA